MNLTGDIYGKQKLEGTIHHGTFPTVEVTAVENGHRVTFVDVYGRHEFDVMNGEKGDPGDDYVMTDQDKWEVAEMAAKLVEVPECDMSGVVKSVNGATPDTSGNVEIEVEGGASQEQIDTAVNAYLSKNPVSGGMSATAKALLIAILRNAVYTTNQSANITALEAALAVGGGSGEDSGGDTHSHSYTSSVTKAATCTTAGEITYTCSCGHSYTEPIPATGHNYVDGVCTVCGQTQPDTPPSGETQTITFTQTGSVLAISGIDNITTMTQTGSVLALA